MPPPRCHVQLSPREVVVLCEAPEPVFAAGGFGEFNARGQPIVVAADSGRIYAVLFGDVASVVEQTGRPIPGNAVVLALVDAMVEFVGDDPVLVGHHEVGEVSQAAGCRPEGQVVVLAADDVGQFGAGDHCCHHFFGIALAGIDELDLDVGVNIIEGGHEVAEGMVEPGDQGDGNWLL